MAVRHSVGLAVSFQLLNSCDTEVRRLGIRKEGSIRAGRVFCSVTRAVSEEPYIHLGEIDSCQYQFNSIYSVSEKQVHVIKCGIVQYSQ